MVNGVPTSLVITLIAINDLKDFSCAQFIPIIRHQFTTGKIQCYQTPILISPRHQYNFEPRRDEVISGNDFAVYSFSRNIMTNLLYMVNTMNDDDLLTQEVSRGIYTAAYALTNRKISNISRTKS